MVVRWSLTAEENLKAIFDFYLGVAGHRTALKMAVKIRDSADALKTMPRLAAIEPSLDEEPEMFRSLVVRPHYKVVYFVDGETINIVAIWDCRRDPARNRHGVLKRE